MKITYIPTTHKTDIKPVVGQAYRNINGKVVIVVRRGYNTDSLDLYWPGENDLELVVPWKWVYDMLNGSTEFKPVEVSLTVTDAQ